MKRLTSKWSKGIQIILISQCDVSYLSFVMTIYWCLHLICDRYISVLFVHMVLNVKYILHFVSARAPLTIFVVIFLSYSITAIFYFLRVLIHKIWNLKHSFTLRYQKLKMNEIISIYVKRQQKFNCVLKKLIAILVPQLLKGN